MTPLDRLWLTEAIRLREEQAGPLDDQDANRQARASGGDLATRIEHRALNLARRDGLEHAQQHWIGGARLALITLLVLAVFSGGGLALAALGDGRQPVNVFWALGSLLGLNLLMLLGWLAGLVLGGAHDSSLGQLWLWLSGRLARDAKAVHLAPALTVLLRRQSLNRWALGLLVNSLWSVALLCALAMALLLLSTRRYGFVWETTILPQSVFIHLTQLLGKLPGLLGFATPDAIIIRASGDTAVDSARQAWAAWLMGVLLVYGALPRLALAGLCALAWLRGRKRLTLDLNLPGYSRLRPLLMPPSERLGVADPDPGVLHSPHASPVDNPGDGHLLVAIELDSDRPWPPALPAGVRDAGVLDDRHSRHQLLEALVRYPAERLAIACDPRRSADRGTLALIAELSRGATQTRIWLLPTPANHPLDAPRLADWQAALDRLGLSHSGDSPVTWLEQGHD